MVRELTVESFFLKITLVALKTTNMMILSNSLNLKKLNLKVFFIKKTVFLNTV